MCRLLITGFFRGGLGFVADTLRHAGYDIGTTMSADVEWQNFSKSFASFHAVEISSYAVPFLGAPELASTVVLFVTRNPMSVLPSLIGTGFGRADLEDERFDFVAKHLPKFRELRGDPIHASTSYMHNWHKLARIHRPKMKRLRVEDGPYRLLKWLNPEFSGPTTYRPTIRGAASHAGIGSVRGISEEREFAIRKVCRELGYENSVWAPFGGHAHYTNPDWHC